MSDIDWAALRQQLQAPFDPSDVEWRIQGRSNEQTGKAQVVAYVDARVVQDRLDEVVGPGAWAFDWTSVVVEKGDVQVAKGTLTIHGVAKSDAGSASNFEATLGAVSHSFKRAAVQWGIGRYLYHIPGAWVTVERRGKSEIISDAVMRQLRDRLPRPEGTAPRLQIVRDEPAASGSRHRQPPPTNGNGGEWKGPLATVWYRQRLSALGYRSVVQVEEFISRCPPEVNAGTPYRDWCMAALEAEEQRAALAGGAAGVTP